MAKESVTDDEIVTAVAQFDGCSEGKKRFFYELGIRQRSTFSDANAHYVLVKITPADDPKGYRYTSMNNFSDNFMSGLANGESNNDSDVAHKCKYEFAIIGADESPVNAIMTVERFGRNVVQ